MKRQRIVDNFRVRFSSQGSEICTLSKCCATATLLGLKDVATASFVKRWLVMSRRPLTAVQMPFMFQHAGTRRL